MRPAQGLSSCPFQSDLIYNGSMESVNLGSLALEMRVSMHEPWLLSYRDRVTPVSLLRAHAYTEAYSALSRYSLIIATPCQKRERRGKEIRIQLMPCNAAKNRACACSRRVPRERTIDEEISI